LSFNGFPILIEVKEIGREWLFGLVGGQEKTFLREVGGFLLLPEIREAFLVLIYFQFGRIAGK
jgi:hypothetical protein